MVAPDSLFTDQGSVGEESSSNTRGNSSGDPAARRKKTDFKDNIGKLETSFLPLLQN